MAGVDADPSSRWNTGPAIVNFTFANLLLLLSLYLIGSEILNIEIVDDLNSQNKNQYLV